MSILHECDRPELASTDVGYGQAVDTCFEEEGGELWVANGEYCSQVNYCPFCGYGAKKKIEIRVGKSEDEM